MTAFIGDLAAAFIAFVGAMTLMAIGVMLGGRSVRRGCGSPQDCRCGASECRDGKNEIERSTLQ